jgi:hypothetical protein
LISRHIDLIAIAILLFAVGLFTAAKQVVVVTMHGPVRYLHMDDGRQVRAPRMPAVPFVTPHVPRIPLQRD